MKIDFLSTKLSLLTCSHRLNNTSDNQGDNCIFAYCLTGTGNIKHGNQTTLPSESDWGGECGQRQKDQTQLMDLLKPWFPDDVF